LYSDFSDDLEQMMTLNDPGGIYSYCMVCKVQ